MQQHKYKDENWETGRDKINRYRVLETGGWTEKRPRSQRKLKEKQKRQKFWNTDSETDEVE